MMMRAETSETCFEFFGQNSTKNLSFSLSLLFSYRPEDRHTQTTVFAADEPRSSTLHLARGDVNELKKKKLRVCWEKNKTARLLRVRERGLDLLVGGHIIDDVSTAAGDDDDADRVRRLL